MRTRENKILSWAAAALIVAASAVCGQNVTGSEPASGATGVATDIGEIRVHFDSDMLTDSFTVVDAPNGEFPPTAGDNSRPWRSARLFAIRVGELQPGTTYALQLNAANRRGFQSSARRPLPVTVIRFTTASPVTEAEKNGAMRVRLDGNGGAVAVNNGQPARTLTPQVGWRFKVNRNTMVDVTARQGGQTSTMIALAKAEFEEKVTRVEGAKASEVTRKVNTLVLKKRSSEFEGVKEEKLCPDGSEFRVAFQNGRGKVSAVNGTAMNQMLANALSIPITPAILPEGELTHGRRWSYRDDQVSERLWFMDTRGGSLDLQVDRIITDEDTGLQIAMIQGKLITKVQLGEMLLDYQADVELIVPVAIGVPVGFHIKGKLSGEVNGRDNQGRPIRYTVSGEGELHQSAIPTNGICEDAYKAQSGSDESAPLTVILCK